MFSLFSAAVLPRTAREGRSTVSPIGRPRIMAWIIVAMTRPISSGC